MPRSKQPWEDWINQSAQNINLPMRFTVSDEPPEDKDVIAYIRFEDGYRRGSIWLAPAFYKKTPAAQCLVLAHELGHGLTFQFAFIAGALAESKRSRKLLKKLEEDLAETIAYAILRLIPEPPTTSSPSTLGSLPATDSTSP